jgi:hypothetical protein
MNDRHLRIFGSDQLYSIGAFITAQVNVFEDHTA